MFLINNRLKNHRSLALVRRCRRQVSPCSDEIGVRLIDDGFEFLVIGGRFDSGLLGLKCSRFME